MDEVGEAVPTSEVQYTTAKISVWWDFDFGECSILKKDLDPHRVAHNICSALVRMNFHGPVSIFCYGDTTRIPESLQETLLTTGIAIKHVTADDAEASCKRILVDMLLWAMENPAPANYLLISDDVDLSYAIHQLLMKRYNILLAVSPYLQSVTSPLIAAAKIVWHWTSLLAGGPPLSNGESQQLGNSSLLPSSETLPVPVSNATQTQQQGVPDSEVPYGSRYLSPTESVHDLARVVLLAINSLKNEMIAPFKNNIADCIRYGDPKYRNTKVSYALKSAMELQMVVEQKIGSMMVYLGKNDKLWECVTPMVAGIPSHYSEEIWDAIHNSLTTPAGRSAIVGAQCRYEAAIVIKDMIKNTCFKDIALGYVLQIFDLLIWDKKWIVVPPGPVRWQVLINI